MERKTIYAASLPSYNLNAGIDSIIRSREQGRLHK